MATNAFQRSLPVQARMFAGKHNLKTVFGSQTPATDGKTVWYPPLPMGEVSKETRALFMRWNDHEVIGHCLETNFSLLRRNDVQAEILEKPILKGLLNAIEDPRIEVRAVKRYPGTNKNLREGLRVMVEKKEIKDGTSSPSDALQMYVCHWGRMFLLGHTEVEPYYLKARESLSKLIEESGVQRLEGLLSSRMGALTDTEDAYKLSKQILKLMEDITEEQKHEPPEETPEDNDEDQSDEDGKKSSDSSDSDDNGNGGKDDSSSGSSNSNEEDEEEGNSSSSGDGRGEIGEDDSPSNGGAQSILDDTPTGNEAVDTTAALQSGLDNEAEANDGRSGGSGAGAQPHNDAGPVVEAAHSLEIFNQTKCEMTAQVATLKGRLLAIVQVHKKIKKVSCRRGRINSRALHRVAVNNPDVFYRKEEISLPAAAVSVLVDLSGSMNGEREKMAQLALIALAEACSSIGVPLELNGFGGKNSHAAGMVKIKPFGQSFQSALPALGGYVANGNGDWTPMGEGMFEAAISLSQQNTTRKVLFVLTDGSSSNHRYAVEVARLIEGSGMELFGVGIQTDAVKGIFSKYSVVTSVNTLGEELLTLFERTQVFQAA